MPQSANTMTIHEFLETMDTAIRSGKYRQFFKLESIFREPLLLYIYHDLLHIPKEFQIEPVCYTEYDNVYGSIVGRDADIARQLKDWNALLEGCYHDNYSKFDEVAYCTEMLEEYQRLIAHIERRYGRIPLKICCDLSETTVSGGLTAAEMIDELERLMLARKWKNAAKLAVTFNDQLRMYLAEDVLELTAHFNQGNDERCMQYIAQQDAVLAELFDVYIFWSGDTCSGLYGRFSEGSYLNLKQIIERIERRFGKITCKFHTDYLPMIAKGNLSASKMLANIKKMIAGNQWRQASRTEYVLMNDLLEYIYTILDIPPEQDEEIAKKDKKIADLYDAIIQELNYRATGLDFLYEDGRESVDVVQECNVHCFYLLEELTKHLEEKYGMAQQFRMPDLREYNKYDDYDDEEE